LKGTPLVWNQAWLVTVERFVTDKHSSLFW
jgi:hypothetical protein